MGDGRHGCDRRCDLWYQRSHLDRLESDKHDGTIWDDGGVDDSVDVLGIRCKA
jgi:hypothetical protein